MEGGTVLDFDALSASIRQARLGGGVDDDLRNRIIEELPLPYVMMAYAHRCGVPQLDASGEWGCRCPTHDDHSPSLKVMAANPTRAYCHVCARPFNAFNLISQWEGWIDNSEFPQAVARALELWQLWQQDENRDAYLATAKPEDQRDWTAIQQEFEARATDPALLAAFFATKGFPAGSAEWITREFRLSTRVEFNRELIEAPYYDALGVMRALKARPIDASEPLLGPGRVRDVPYGAWRDRGQGVVYVCEGESDTWMVAWHLRETDALVIGFPGVAHALNPSDAWIEILSNRTIILVLDGDEAGKNATAALARRLAGMPVYTVPLPHDAEQKDISQQPDIQDLLSHPLAITAAAPTPLDYGFDRIHDSLVTYTADGAPIRRADWWFEPVYCASVYDKLGARTEELMWVGNVRWAGNMRTEVVLTADDLKDHRALNAWATGNGLGGYNGDQKTAIALSMWLTQLRPWLSPARAVPSIGLYGDSTFVLPNREPIGPGRNYFYTSNVSFPSLKLPKPVRHPSLSEFDSYALGARLLFTINEPGVMTPLMAWHAAAPLRSLFDVFPTLAVFGSSGTGKSTTVGAVARFFGYAGAFTDTKATFASLRETLGGTNAFPVYIDEYRPTSGANDGALENVDELINCAWDGTALSKMEATRGGTWVRVETPIVSPLVIMGESEYVNKRQIERSAVVRLRHRSSDVFAEQFATWNMFMDPPADEMFFMPPHSFGGVYLEWLTRQLRAGDISLPRAQQDRQATTQSILEFGWALLNAFLDEFHHPLAVVPDWTLIGQALEEARLADPIHDVMHELFSMWSSGDVPSTTFAHDNGWVVVRADIALTAAKRRLSTAIPPRTAPALIQHLVATVADAQPRNGREVALPLGWFA